MPSVVGTPAASLYSTSIAITTGTGANLAIGVNTLGGGTLGTMSATYGGTGMTTELTRDFGYATRRIALHALVNPASGSQTYATATTSGTQRARAVCTLSGVDTADPFGTAVTNGTDEPSTSPTVTITSATGDLAIAVLTFSATATVTAGADETIVVQYAEDTWGCAIITKAGASSVTFAPTLSTGATWGIIGVSVQPEAAGPTITDQPDNATVILSNGSSAALTVAATSSGGPLTYQWQRDTGSGFSNIVGAISATLNLSGVVIGDNGYDYRCAVTDTNGTTNSASANLAVYRGPRIATAFGATNGSGVSTGAIETDFANSLRAGSFIRIVDASGARTSRLGTTP